MRIVSIAFVFGVPWVTAAWFLSHLERIFAASFSKMLAAWCVFMLGTSLTVFARFQVIRHGGLEGYLAAAAVINIIAVAVAIMVVSRRKRQTYENRRRASTTSDPV